MANKRKDTKIYEQTVKDYCHTRGAFEMFNEMVKTSSEGIEKAKERFEELNKDITDGEVKVWYDFYVQMNQAVINMNKERLESLRKELDTLSDTLQYDYYEDLDKLYKEKKYDW